MSTTERQSKLLELAARWQAQADEESARAMWGGWTQRDLEWSATRLNLFISQRDECLKQAGALQ